MACFDLGLAARCSISPTVLPSKLTPYFMTPVVDKTLEREDSSVSIPWAAIGWFATLLAICYLPVLARLVSQWNNDEDMSHGFFVPILAGYIAWQNRDKFFAEPARPN